MTNIVKSYMIYTITIYKYIYIYVRITLAMSSLLAFDKLR